MFAIFGQKILKKSDTKMDWVNRTRVAQFGLRNKRTSRESDPGKRGMANGGQKLAGINICLDMSAWALVRAVHNMIESTTKGWKKGSFVNLSYPSLATIVAKKGGAVVGSLATKKQ